MNYGYFAENFYPKLEKNDEPERYPIHLYHRVATQINLSGKKVLEVGSGRGGGLGLSVRCRKARFAEFGRGVDVDGEIVARWGAGNDHAIDRFGLGARDKAFLHIAENTLGLPRQRIAVAAAAIIDSA